MFPDLGMGWDIGRGGPPFNRQPLPAEPTVSPCGKGTNAHRHDLCQETAAHGPRKSVEGLLLMPDAAQFRDDHPDKLRAQTARARRHAKQIADAQTSTRLLELAEELDTRAAAIERSNICWAISRLSLPLPKHRQPGRNWMSSEEAVLATLGPEPIHEAQAIIKGIQALAAAKR
jgi:hypothetical protein